jgi:hypothetical protein
MGKLEEYRGVTQRERDLEAREFGGPNNGAASMLDGKKDKRGS